LKRATNGYGRADYFLQEPGSFGNLQAVL
jgi:hypothetical protein